MQVISRSIVILVSILALALAACGDDDENGGGMPGLPGTGGAPGGGDVSPALAAEYCALQCEQARVCDDYTSEDAETICGDMVQQTCVDSLMSNPVPTLPQTRQILECIIERCEAGLSTDDATDACTPGN